MAAGHTSPPETQQSWHNGTEADPGRLRADCLWCRGSTVGVEQACCVTNTPSGREAVQREEAQERQGAELSPCSETVSLREGWGL